MIKLNKISYLIFTQLLVYLLSINSYGSNLDKTIDISDFKKLLKLKDESENRCIDLAYQNIGYYYNCNGNNYIMLKNKPKKIILNNLPTNGPKKEINHKFLLCQRKKEIFDSGGFKDVYFANCNNGVSKNKLVILESKECNSKVSIKEIKESLVFLKKVKNKSNFVEPYFNFHHCGSSECKKYCFLHKKYDGTLYNLFSNKVELNLRQRKSISIQLLRILEQLYIAELVHGDIKPDNIFYSYDTNKNSYSIYLGDLDSMHLKTNESLITYTPSYLSTDRYSSIIKSIDPNFVNSTNKFHLGFYDDLTAIMILMDMIMDNEYKSPVHSQRKLYLERARELVQNIKDESYVKNLSLNERNFIDQFYFNGLIKLDDFNDYFLYYTSVLQEEKINKLWLNKKKFNQLILLANNKPKFLNLLKKWKKQINNK